MIERSTFTILVWVWIGTALVLFPILLTIPAPYGRHSSKQWGPMIGNRLGWFLMEFPALAVFLLFALPKADFHNIVVILAIFLWIAHYFHRDILFPLRIRTAGKKMPVVIMLFALFFNTVNGFVNGYWVGNFCPLPETNAIFFIRIISGLLLFVAGYSLNQYHDRILIRLRKGRKSGYQIPYGGLFRYLSCPNFFGEIIEWSGFAILCWSVPALSFFIWTCVNLIPRALDHHKWYVKEFADYPSGRKAIIPFLL
jgi:3-oxo-5-alpha-steroid 4-dehydrogenase 1